MQDKWRKDTHTAAETQEASKARPNKKHVEHRQGTSKGKAAGQAMQETQGEDKWWRQCKLASSTARDKLKRSDPRNPWSSVLVPGAKQPKSKYRVEVG